VVADYFMYRRFLRARQHDVERAKEMWANHLKWRKVRCRHWHTQSSAASQGRHIPLCSQHLPRGAVQKLITHPAPQEIGADTILEDFDFPERESFVSLYPQGYCNVDKKVHDIMCIAVHATALCCHACPARCQAQDHVHNVASLPGVGCIQSNASHPWLQGRPIYIQQLGQLQFKKLTELTSEERMIKFHVQVRARSVPTARCRGRRHQQAGRQHTRATCARAEEVQGISGCAGVGSAPGLDGTGLTCDLHAGLQEYERCVRYILPACSRTAGHHVEQTFAILDMKGGLGSTSDNLHAFRAEALVASLTFVCQEHCFM
jgi:hypothetical protein